MRKYAVCMVLCLAVLLQSAVVQAQGVYMTRDKAGPVFSDMPQAGSKEVSLPPLNVVAPPPAVSAASAANAANAGQSQATSGAAAGAGNVGAVGNATPPYRSFSITSPENNGSVLANTAIFEVRVAVDPSLRLGEGHAFAVSVNGQALNQRFTSTEFMIPPEFWGNTLPAGVQTLQLDARIVDRSGRILMQAQPVSFYLRHATVWNNPNYRPAQLPVYPTQLPVYPEQPAQLPVYPAQRPIAKPLPAELEKTSIEKSSEVGRQPAAEVGRAAEHTVGGRAR